MRKYLITAAALAMAAVPAAAQEPVYDDPRDAEIADALPDQAEFDEMAVTLDRVLGAMLDMEIAPVLEAVDPHRRTPPGERTLRDMAERSDPYFEDRMRHNLYGASSSMGRMVEAFSVLMPVMRHSLEQTARDVEEALDDYPRR